MHVRSACPGDGRPRGSNLLVDDTNKVLYCFLPKVACSTFKALMISSASNMTIDEVMSKVNSDRTYLHDAKKTPKLRRLSDYSTAERIWRLGTYFKFMVVRHPFDRLLSAWRDKIERRKITTVTEDHVSRFRRFAESVAVGRKHVMADHWNPMTFRCDPCRVQYDVIVKLESVDRDMPAIVSRLNIPGLHPDSLPVINVKSCMTPMEKLSMLHKFYSRLDEPVIKRLVDIYRDDLRLFGYSWDVKSATGKCEFLKSYSSNGTTAGTSSCC